jgi:predicted HicB family RNase H-like nuclease
MAERPKRAISATAIRFPPDLHAELKQAADERYLSINFLVVAAVREFLPRLIPADELRLTRREDDDA